MGQRLEKYFDLAMEKGGLPAQMRFAMKFGMASTKAVATPDTPALIEKAKATYGEIMGDPNPPTF